MSTPLGTIHPPCHARQLDDPATTVTRAALLQRHGYLRRLYESWYRSLLGQLPACGGIVLELGSGGGFLKELMPSAVTSDVLDVPGIDIRLDARMLPFEDSSLRAILATNVLHHVPDIARFLSEASRALAPGGRIIAIEPWPTPFSRLVYRYLHHEPFDERRDWSLPPGGPLTAANGALPWIVLCRDRGRFEREFPKLVVRAIAPRMPATYIACGGIGGAWPLPAVAFNVIRMAERPFDRLGLFALVVLESRP